MRIVLLSPLYPPDTAPSAAYVKELAKRLAERYNITVLTYGALPEQVPGVHLVAVDKRATLPVRLVRFFFVLWRAAQSADVLYAGNGASVELPLALVMVFKKPRVIFNIADAPAHAWAQKTTLRRAIEQFVSSRAEVVVEGLPMARPEILPFAPYPTEQFAEFEASWRTHLHKVEETFAHA